MKKACSIIGVLLWLYGLFVHTPLSYGQSLPSFKFQSFTTAQGLPASEASSFSETARGFLWISTNDGVSRFDGFKFKNYRMPVIDSNQISGTNLMVQVRCFQNQVWCMNNLGHFFRLDPLLDIFVDAKFSIRIDTRKKVAFSSMDFLYDSIRACFWVKDIDEVFKYDLKSGRVEQVLDFNGGTCWSIVLDTNGRLWCPTDAGEICFDPANNSKTIYFKNKVFTANCLMGSKIWCMNKCDTLYYIDVQTGIVSTVKTNAKTFFKTREPDCVQDIIFAPGISGDSLLWMATCGEGLLVVDVINGVYVSQFRTETHENEGFKQDWVNRIFATHDGCLWIATQKGILKIDVRHQYFFTEKIPSFKTLQISRVRQVLTNPANPDEKWVATADGLFLYNTVKNEITKTFFLRSDEKKRGKPGEKISAMQFDDQNNLWLGTNTGLIKIDPFFQVKKFGPAKPPNAGVFDFVPIGDDAFWVRNNSNAGLFWPERGQYFPIHFPTRKEGSPIDLFYLNAGLDKSALFSTDSAVYRVRLSELDPTCQCFPRPSVVLSVLLPSDLIENDTAIWVDVPNGLAEFHQKKHTIRIFGEKEGLTNLRVRSVLEKDGQFWLNSDNGLFVFHPKQGRFKKYGAQDGLEDNFIPGILTPDKNVFHAGFNYAFTTFQPNARLLETRVKPVITDVYALKERVPVDFSAIDSAAITVEHHQNILRFEFTCPDFYQSENNTFQYQLEGFDIAPISAGFNRSAVYTNLDGGSYRFLVWATNADGFRYPEPAVVLLRVIPPFYRTSWFYLVCFAAIGFLFYLIFRYREIQRLRQEQLRLRIARDLHDEVGSTLSAISILSQTALYGLQQDLDKVRFSNIGDKARSALESMSDIVWSVNPQNDSMQKVVERLTLFATETLETVGISLKVSVGDGVTHLNLPMAKRKEFYMIVKEAVTNCARHSRAKNAHIVLEKENGHLIFQLWDDGVGLPADLITFKKLSNLQGSIPNGSRPAFGGNGLKNMAARATAMGGDLSVTSEPGAGTMVWLSVPLN